jgi:hypothetical protein
MEANREAPSKNAGADGTTGNGADAVPSDGEALATLGAACVDDGTATASLHTDQKTVGTGAAGFGCLISAFHDDFPDVTG